MKRRPSPYTNATVDIDGKRWRIVRHYERVIMIGWRRGAGAERFIEPKGRKGREVLRIAEQQRDQDLRMPLGAP